MIKISTKILFMSLIIIAMSRLAEAKTPLPSKIQYIISAHGIFEYIIPADWHKNSFNSYKGEAGIIIEQTHPSPSGKITEEYCNSFVTIPRPNIRKTEMENCIYDNGKIRGCYVIKDLMNIQTKRETRHVSFRFKAKSGVEDLTIILTKEKYDENLVKSIINSIRIK